MGAFLSEKAPPKEAKRLLQIVSGAALDLRSTQLSADELVHALPKLRDEELRWFVRQWMTEGIPAAFANAPIQFENVRDWLAKKIRVAAKDLTLIGSARFGYSLVPKKFGRAFGSGSDLDFSIISKPVFSSFQDVFELWKREFHKGVVEPNSEKEREYWEANLAGVPNQLRRGMVDLNKLPWRSRYQPVQSVAQAAYLLRRELRSSSEFPDLKSASIRIYRDWTSFENQQVLNLGLLVKHFEANVDLQ